jgi:phosphoribosylamine--glycine ligase
MGAYCPVRLPAGVLDEIQGKVLEPTVDELRRRGVDYRGVLYAGLMLTSAGPRVLEYNVRFGDPEAQAVLPLLEGDVAGLLASVARGELAAAPAPSVADGACVTVMLCSEGYPAAPDIGERITGLEDAAAIEGVTVFHASTRTGPGGYLVTGGGRVLAVTGRGPTVDEARDRAYRAAAVIEWPGVHYRRDIAASA